MNFDKLLAIIGELISSFSQFAMGFWTAKERGSRKQAEAKLDILKEQQEIDRQPDVENPLKAMREHGKKKG